MARVLMEGNQALAEGAIRAGCRHFFGYPITPQSEIPEYFAGVFPEIDGVYLQAESEVSAINMVYGAAGTGHRVLTASSSPGISLMAEGLSYIAGAELPCVVINIMRGGPGLGNIAPSQGDYNQATKGIGHGDFHLIVLAPNSVQEMADLTFAAFDIADIYRNPVMIVADGVLGQMREPVEITSKKPLNLEKPWATTGASGRSKNIINTLLIDPEELETHNLKLQNKYSLVKQSECRSENFYTDDAELLVVAFGLCSRIALHAVKKARARGLKVGLVRPISLWPFPEREIEAAARSAKTCLVVEMNEGQMIYDVQLSIKNNIPVKHFGRFGGMVPTPEEILEKITEIEVHCRE